METATLLKNIREDAIAIFKAGIKAVAPGTAMARFCNRHNDALIIGSETYNLNDYQDVYVIGAGKATAPMAAALEDLLGDRLSAGVITVKYNTPSRL